MSTTNTINDAGSETAKPSIKKIQYNIDGIEHSFEEEQEYSENVHGEDEAIQIVFENGAIVRYRKTDDREIIEETFQSNDSHSVFNGMEIPASDLVKSVEVTVEEYNQNSRNTKEDFDDWELLQEVLF